MVRHGVFHSRDHSMETQAVLAVPFMVSMLLIYGLLHVFRVPTEPRANWVFRMAECHDASHFLPPVSKAVSMAALLPVLAITPLATAYALGWRIALLHTAFACLIALLLAEYKIADWDRIPFTSSYVAGRRPFFQTACVAVLYFVLLTTIVTGIEMLLLRGVGIYVALAVLAAVYLRKTFARRLSWSQSWVQFEDEPEQYMKLGIAPE